MIEHFYDYLFFFARVLTVVIALFFLFAGIMSIATKAKKEQTKGSMRIFNFNDRLKEMGHVIKTATLDKSDLKAEQKIEKNESKQKKSKKKSAEKKSHVYVLDFHGDIKASAVSSLRQEITAVLSHAAKHDEVVVRLESGGGMVHSYGLAAAQLQRIKNQGIPLTITIDKVAASGGYMMACIGDKLIASPFAMLGSIGVVAQLPNFNRLLKKHDVDYEMLTAGEHKRTLTLFGENTEKGRQKFIDDLEDTHKLFKEFVSEHRPQLDINAVATGEVWFGRRALEKQLIDELKTSDQYLVDRSKDAVVYEVEYQEKKTLQEKFSFLGADIVDRSMLMFFKRIKELRFFS